MEKTARILTLLVAYPSDVDEEVAALSRVVEEINRDSGPDLGARLELVDWKTHGRPGIGTYPQGVLNQQFPQDYNIFLGVMWARLGTPTPQAGSGTEEEFDQALERYRKSPGSVRIMFYFKNAHIEPDAIDLEQFRRVREFRDKLVEAGVLYWSFTSTNHFRQLVRSHLLREMREIMAPAPVDIPLAEAPTNDDSATDEVGYLEYLDEAEAQFDVLKPIVERMSQAITDVGAKIRKHTEGLKELEAGGRRLSRREMRIVFRRAASDMDDFSSTLASDLPSFHAALAAGTQATKAAALLAQQWPAHEAQLKKNQNDLSILDNTLGEAILALTGFRQSVQDLPRMTVDLIRARATTSSVLSAVLDAMTVGKHTVEATMEALNGNSSPSPPRGGLEE